MKLSSAILILAFLLMPVSALADFSGVYDPANWTYAFGTGNPPGGGGSVDTGGAPASIILNGGDSGCSSFGTCWMDYTTTAPASGPASFDWDYVTTDVDGPALDIFFLLNGAVVTQLSDNAGPNVQSGTENFNVQAGDTFGFRIDPTDTDLGPATVTISNFNAPVPAAAIPTMNEWGMIILSLLMAGTAFWFLRRRTITEGF